MARARSAGDMLGCSRCRRPPAGDCTTTFSSTDSPARSRLIWNVRATPFLVIRCGGRPSIRAPSNRMAPASGRCRPLIRLNTVVLPAPFGPISAVMLPCATANEQPSTARMPPNDLLRSRISKSAKIAPADPRGAASAGRRGRRARRLDARSASAYQAGFGQRRGEVPGNSPIG